MAKFEEYKFFVESTQHLSERRQAATRTYLTVRTVIFAVLAFLVRDARLGGWGVVLSLPLFVVGMLACRIWSRIISQYKELIGWRYEQLMSMEGEIPESHQMYRKEWEQFYQPRQGRERFGFSRLEAWLPRLFFALYLVYVAGLIVAAAVGWLSAGTPAP